ncbi:L-arabinose isomerase [Pedobacter sp. AK017]|uniref:L-arabinose isomerase n=1 Tax=Pedobacter sp. AK017 TaxID=2723073 RepID=UPI00161A8B13|nr:L-arabinose isomerase [Pedobacter sp. AK017]MBB5437852.1 L-arabinose isomerase [Pedobacter sp. AK017]
MINLKNLEVWFITGTQDLYGEETLKQVAKHAQQVAASLDAAAAIHVSIVYKPIVKTPQEIFDTLQQANQSKNCIGVMTWMHTFSPAKMWIRGLNILQKPLLHLHTQFNRDIPWATIDMDFMNLNQSAHGDREFGFMVTRMRKDRKVVVGHWQDEEAIKEIDTWTRAAAGWHDWQGARFVRFGDNMRYVAVTDGDKVEAELKFGFEVNTYGIGDLVAVIDSIPEAAIQELLTEYEATYTMTADLLRGGERHDSVYQAAKIELGLKKFLEDGNFKGFSDTFEDLHGMVQLPGIAAQRLMAAGYGFAGEGDWKTAALVRACKVMGAGLPGTSAFMEDYTYHFDPANAMVLGSHMLEVDAALANGKARLEVHPLGIGGKADPARLIFNVAGGHALNASIVDMGNRFRLLVNEVEALEPEHELPNLPVAQVLWKPLPDMKTGCAAWIYAGGAHHTAYSQNLSPAHLLDFANIAGIEYVNIGADTRINQFRNELHWNETFYK